MKKILTLIIVLAMALMFTGCGDDSAPVRTAKKEIVVACGKDDTGTIEDIMQEFTTASETTQVKLLDFSNESVELHRVISSMLSGQEIQLDAMLIEDVWVGEFIKNNRLLPLGDAHSFDSGSYPNGIESFVGDEKMYWHPIILDMGLMYCREDLTDEKPTFGELADGEKGTYTLQGADGEEMLCCALEFINLTGSVRGGLELYKRALDNSVSISGNYLMDFKDGKATYMRSWASDSRGLISSYLPEVGAVGAELPVTNTGDCYATARAYGLAINRETKNAENCFELLEYLKSDDAQIRILKGMGTIPLKKKYYEDPMIVDSSNYIVSAGRLFDSFKFRPAREDYTFASREARTALNEYLVDDAALDMAVTAITNLTDRP